VRSSTSSSDQAAGRTWLRIFLAFFIVSAAMLALAICTPLPHGDLSRIGRIDDKVFTWTRAQPVVPAELQRSVAVADADVVVVGDSFSVGLVWQSRLVKAGYRVATVHWDDAEPHCKDFPGWLQGQGFHGKWVIFQTVERAIDRRVHANSDCAGHHRPASTAYATPPLGALPVTAGPNWKTQFTTGVVSLVNTYRARTTERSIVFWNGARVDFVKDGCSLFSHAYCDRVLVLIDDERERRFESDMLEPMKAWSAVYSGRANVLWLVVPNKSSIYLHPEGSIDAGARLAASGLGPDLFSTLRALRTGIVDLYLPDDTHLSTTGFERLGDIALEWIQRREAAPATAL
jgi:hypothetical protein